MIFGDFMVKYRIEIDHSLCQGFGACVELCSEFNLSDEDGKSHLKNGWVVLPEDVC